MFMSHNAEPRLQWTRFFVYERNQNDSYEWEKAKDDIDQLIFPRAMHHPTTNRSTLSEYSTYKA